MSGTVVFLGAGATKSCNGPLTNEILPKIYAQARAEATDTARLAAFLEEHFHVRAASTGDSYPGLPLLLSLLDTALERRQAFSANWDAPSISALRQRVELGIYDLLEAQLASAQTTNHYTLFNSLFPMGGAAPSVVSTNYDLIADTALMFLSEDRPQSTVGTDGTATGDGRLPDYRCGISTEFYRNEPAHFGTLLKLHGSLNWLYCNTCGRLEMGISQAKSFLKVLMRMVGKGQELQQAFTADGDSCPTCGTRLRPLLIAPSHLKYYRNPHLSQVWYEAECVLRAAERVVFIGYSLPEDDVEVIYLLKRALSGPRAPQITVVELDAANPNVSIDAHPVGRRYRTLFGDSVDWHACGLDQWLINSACGGGSAQVVNPSGQAGKPAAQAGGASVQVDGAAAQATSPSAAADGAAAQTASPSAAADGAAAQTASPSAPAEGAAAQPATISAQVKVYNLPHDTVRPPSAIPTAMQAILTDLHARLDVTPAPPRRRPETHVLDVANRSPTAAHRILVPGWPRR